MIDFYCTGTFWNRATESRMKIPYDDEYVYKITD